MAKILTNGSSLVCSTYDMRLTYTFRDPLQSVDNHNIAFERFTAISSTIII